MTNSVPKKKTNVRYLVLMAMFVALAYVIECVFHIKVSFLTFDLKDFVITIGAMILGPVSALAMSAVVSLVEFLTISDTGIWGLIMNFAGTVAFSLPAALIYRYKKTLAGAIVAMVTAVVSMTAVMLVANLIITPIYTGTNVATVVSMIPTLLLPFNLAKAILNSGVVLLFYKPIITALRSAHLIPSEGTANRTGKNTVVMVLIAIVFLAVSIVILVSMNASASWFDTIKSWFTSKG
ncbi:MAG: ECF transporter S component [Eubacteriales bacterium]